MTISQLSLRSRFVEALTGAERGPRRARALRERPVVIFGPRSYLGTMHLPGLVAAGANIVLAVDDLCRESQVNGIPVRTSAAFLAGAGRVRDAVMVDFTTQPYAQTICRQLAEVAGLQRYDLLELLAAYDGVSVYETVPDMRLRTLERADDWLALVERFADDFSRETLYAVLLQRLDYSRDVVHAVNLWGRDEYFGVGPQSDTFLMGTREHFVDCGAHRGTVIQKLLAATRGRYAGIHAFEPDVDNYSALQWMTPFELPGLHAHRCAVSDRREVLRFAQTGTMSSHVTGAGSIEVQAVTLDETVEQASFIKMDVEGYEPSALRGAARLLARQRPRLAIAAYHYAHDLLNIVKAIDECAPDYVLRLRQHCHYYYDTILYASPRQDWLPADDVR